LGECKARDEKKEEKTTSAIHANLLPRKLKQVPRLGLKSSLGMTIHDKANGITP